MTYNMDETETRGWYHEDAIERDAARAAIRDMAAQDAEDAGCKSVEIHGADGITADAFDLDWA